jgi:cytochrome c-type biogenesis protein CcmH/NrfF
LALLIVAPAALAQDNNDMMMGESTMMDQSMMDQNMMNSSNMMDQGSVAQPKMMDQGSMGQPKMMQMPNTGGPSLGLWLLPAGALLVGTSLMGGYIVRQRS